MDQLGHVNNVRYVDYLQEARADLFRQHRGAQQAGAGQALVEGIVVVRHEVAFLQPIHYERRPVSIECWVTRIRAGSFTLAYELFREQDGERTTYARASTVLAPYRFDVEQPRRLTAEEKTLLEGYREDGPVAAADHPPADRPPAPNVVPTPERHCPITVRFSDVDVYRHVNNVQYFEYFQEARIRYFTTLAESLTSTQKFQVVVAQTDVDYHEALTLRAEPYDCWTRVAGVGRRSMTVESILTPPGDPDRVLSRARVVLVFFDATTERSAEPDPAFRQAMLAAVGDG